MVYDCKCKLGSLLNHPYIAKMKTSKTIRASIKPHLQHYFLGLQAQLECDSPTEVLNYLLADLKLKGYSLIDDVKYIPAPFARQEQATPFNLPLSEQETPVVDAETDAVIERLAYLLEDF
ncbi:hypothetical protein NIES25_70190 (plasmid) [Nostoc linckia NIES-25]|jgi:hypothetical protein|nr:hypothetical protein NIES25_70190 [Nostoc linckia NIES-25]